MDKLIIKPNTINFQELVYGNSDQLTLNFKSKMINKLESNFTEFQTRWFIANVYAFLMYHSTKDFPINIDTIYKLIGFANKANAKRALINNFTKDEDYKINVIPRDEALIKPGQNEEIIMLNIDTFKSLCMIVKTDKAKEIRKYYVKLENIFNEIVNEERLEYENKQKELENNRKELENTNKLLIKQNESDRHYVLLNRYARTRSLVYIIKVKSYKDGSFVVKIGHSSIGLELRYNRHKYSYEEAIILDCFKVDKSSEFESYIHTHIYDCICLDLPGHETERELFLIKSLKDYNQLIFHINENQNLFNYTDSVDITDLQKEVKRLQNENQNINNPINNSIDITFFNKVIDNQNNMLKIINNMNINQIKLENIITTISNTKNPIQEYNTIIKPTQGPKVVQINAQDLKVYKIYETIIELLNSDALINRNSLKRAIEKKSIYKNYRWMFINRDQDVKNIIIEKTNENEEARQVGYIAKLNKYKTEIINVYYSMQSAVEKNGKIQRSDSQYILYEQCSLDLRYKFEQKYGKPLLYQNGIGKYNENNCLINEFASKQDCFRKVNISRALLDKIIKEKSIYNGFIYKYIGKKIEMVN